MFFIFGLLFIQHKAVPTVNLWELCTYVRGYKVVSMATIAPLGNNVMSVHNGKIKTCIAMDFPCRSKLISTSAKIEFQNTQTVYKFFWEEC